VGEFARWLKSQQQIGTYSSGQVRHYLRLDRSFFPVRMPTLNVLDRALDLSDQYMLSHRDSMLVPPVWKPV
jgi:hypothetical protein